MDAKEQRPKVGIGVMVFKEGKVLMGKRNSGDVAGKYIFPGGKLEYLESLEECARRETREEAGIEIKNLLFLQLRNELDYAPKHHYINIGFVAEWESGEARVMEPDKFDSWGWYPLDKLPTPLFEATPFYIEAYKTGKHYFDA